MPYTFSAATNVLKIAEQEYGSGAEISFTKFTSCIGVIAKKGSTLTAAHLVMKAKDKDETLFGTGTAADLLALMPDTYDKVTIIGCIALWENPQNNVQAAFQKLTAGLKTLEKVQQYPLASGTYGAKVDGDDIELTYS